jgi:hypothetical protein
VFHLFEVVGVLELIAIDSEGVSVFLLAEFGVRLVLAWRGCDFRALEVFGAIAVAYA